MGCRDANSCTSVVFPGILVQHIRGHQDLHTPYAQLTLLAQLNVDADSLANEYQRDFVALVPTCCCSRLQAPTSSPLKEQCLHIIKKRFGIAREVSHCGHTSVSVIPGQHSRSLRSIGMMFMRALLPAVFNSALISLNWLMIFSPPTVTCIAHPVRNLCPLCRHTVEDRDHVLKCSHVSRQNWQKQFLLDIRTHCTEMETNAVLTNVLMLAGIDGWLHDPSSEYLLYPQRYPYKIRWLISQQNRIGWRQVFSGRFSLE